MEDIKVILTKQSAQEAIGESVWKTPVETEAQMALNIANQFAFDVEQAITNKSFKRSFSRSYPVNDGDIGLVQERLAKHLPGWVVDLQIGTRFNLFGYTFGGCKIVISYE